MNGSLVVGTIGGIDLVFAVAIALLVLGVVGSVVPLLPSGLLSLSGLLVYWIWGNGLVHPIVLAALAIAALLAAALEHLGGPLAAKAGGASNQVMAAAAIAGFLLFFIAGPIGVILGVVGTVFGIELSRGTTIETAAKRGVYTGLGILASTVMQLLMTAAILLGFLLAVVI